MLSKILIGLAVFLLLLLVGGVYVLRRANSELEGEDKEARVKLQPRVIKSSAQFHKSVFYATENLGEVSEILIGWPADQENAAITVVGNRGAYFLDENGTLKKQIHFSRFIACPIRVSRLDARGNYGFLTRDQSWSTSVILFDRAGQESWSYGGMSLSGFDDATSGDLEGNGKMEVVAGLNGGGGLVLLDDAGRIIWRRPEGNVWHVEILDTTETGQGQILHSNAAGQLLVRNAKGEVIKQYLPGHYVSDFSLTLWGGEPQAKHILAPSQGDAGNANESVIFILDALGAVVARFDDPFGELMHRTVGTPVTFAKGNEYFAVLQDSPPPSRSQLILFDKSKQIVYQEIIEDSCLALTTLLGPQGDRLLLGCENKVLEYSPTTVAGLQQTQRSLVPSEKRP
jgi:hypothetical protein